MLDIGTCIISYIVFSDLIRLTYFSSHYLVPDMISWYRHLRLPWYVCDIYTPGLDMRFLNLTLWPCDTVCDFIYTTLYLSRILYDHYIHVTDRMQIFIALICRSDHSCHCHCFQFLLLSAIFIWYFTGIITVLSFPLSLVYTCWSDSDGSILFFSI